MKVVAIIILFTFISHLYASMTQTQIQSILDVHNQARALVCQSGLEWDDAAAKTAQNYLDNNGGQCPPGHSTQSLRDSSYRNFGGTCSNPTFPYCSTAMLGENIAWGSIGFYTPAKLVDLWVGEKADFSCGTLPSYQSSTGHYSQVVWSGTTRVGCGIRDCSDGMTMLLCNYYPLGNFNAGSTLAFPAKYCSANGQCGGVLTTKVPAPVHTSSPPIPVISSAGPRTRVVPQPTQSNSNALVSLSAWSPLMGSMNDWSISGTNTLDHIGSSFSAITLTGSTASTNDGTDIFIVADINPGSSSKYGLAVNAKTGPNGLQFNSFKYDNGVYKICFAFAARPFFDCCGTYKQIPPHGLFKMRHTIIGTKHYYQGYIGDQALSRYQIDNTWGGGDQGVTASADASFNSFYVSTPASLSITLSTCSMSNSDIINLVATQLGVDTSLIANVQRNGCAKKRSIQAETVSVLLVGTESVTAQDLAQYLVSNPTSEMTSVSIESTTINDVIADAGNALQLPLTPFPTTTTPGLSIAAIAGIAAGCFVGAVGIGVGIFFAVKSRSKESNNQEAEIQENVQHKEPTPKKVKGVDIFNLDPNNPQSLTARNPNIVVNSQNVV